MKNAIIISCCFMLFFAFGITTEATARVGQGESCKVEVLDCPGWGTGNRQICHVNGNGVDCTCGQSTKCGGNDE